MMEIQMTVTDEVQAEQLKQIGHVHQVILLLLVPVQISEEMVNQLILQQVIVMMEVLLQEMAVMEVEQWNLDGLALQEM